MNASDLFPPSEFLKSEDVEANGGEMQLTIKGIAFKDYEEDDGKKTRKGILSFSEMDKKMSLNVTNTRVLITMFGDKDIDVGWIGKPVVLYVDPNVPYGTKIVKGLRIRLVDEKQNAVTSYWTKAREMGFTQPEGMAHLRTFDNDFKAALAALSANPF